MKLCLIVDDATVIRKVARHIVEQLGYIVIEAETGKAAIEQCRREMPDLILLDWHLPEISAHELLASIRAIRSERDPEILYCTTENDPTDLRRAFSGGITDYILKPYDRESLQTKIAQLGRLYEPVE